jgi:hypothetical protein
MGTKRDDPTVSAQVLLKTARGDRAADAEITAENIRALAPPAETSRAVAQAFAKLGFDVGPVVGLGFSITASRSTFTRALGAAATGEKPGEVSLTHLPADVRRHVAAIAFPEPPDFGPGKY